MRAVIDNRHNISGLKVYYSVEVFEQIVSLLISFHNILFLVTKLIQTHYDLHLLCPWQRWLFE